MARHDNGPAFGEKDGPATSRNIQDTGPDREAKALELLNRQTHALNTARCYAVDAVNLVAERVRLATDDYDDLKVALVTLHASMAGALDDIIDAKIAAGFVPIPRSAS